MTEETLHVLLVEDDEDDAVLTGALLAEAQGCAFRMTWARTVPEGLARIAAERFDAVLLDYRVGEHSGLDFLGRLPLDRCIPPVILLTGVADRATDLAAMRAGAADYLVKGEITARLLERSVRYAVEQRRSERALRDSEERFRQLAENVGAVFWLYDGDEERTVYVNPEYERVWGRPATRLLAGRDDWRDSLHPDDREHAAGEVALLPPEPYETEYRIVRPDGGVRWIRDRAFPVRDEAGRVYRSAGIAEDVTERKQAQADNERLLREVQVERSRLSTIVMRAPAFICTLRGPDHVYDMVNPPYYALMGHRPLLGRPVREAVPELGEQGLLELLDEVRRSREPFTAVEMPLRLRRGGGAALEQRYVSFVCQPLLEADGSVSGIFVHGVDVTEQVEARREVERLATERRAILHQITDGVVVADPQGRITFVNPVAARMLGREGMGTEAEDYTRAFDLLTVTGEPFPPQEVPLARAALQGEVVTGTELVIRHPDGSRVVAECNASPVYAPDGGRIGAVVAMRDITAQHAAAEELARRERRFRSLVENAEDAVSVLSADGEIVYQSPALARILGWPPEELARRNAFEFIHPADVEQVRSVFADILAHPGTIGMAEYRVMHGDGEWRCMEASGQNLLHDPAVGGVVVNSRDVTARREAEAALRRSEEQLRQAQKMEAVGRLAGGIAHDFNNLLTAIQGNTELLLLDTPEGSSQREDLLEIRRAATRAASLTRQLLAFSRKQVLQPRVMDLNDSITEMERMLRRLIGEDVDLCLALEPALAPIRADPGQVEQVILNLAVNARDAMPRGGRLSVRTRNVELSGEETACFPYRVDPGRYAELTVRDTGEGIPGEVLPYIFEPFFTTKPQGKGTGLGLSTVYGIVKQSGGYVWVDSTEGQGTVFRVLLPHAQGPRDEAEDEDRPASAAPRNATVLVVEDETPVRTMTRRVLERGGYTVLEAGNGAEAVELVSRAETPVHLVLTDVVMPGGGGREVAEALRRLRPGIRVLFMSGYTDDALVNHGVAKTGTELIEKPFAPAGLLAKVRQVLEREPG